VKARFIMVFTLVLLVGAPLAGGLAAGLPKGFTSFPPLLHYRPDMAGFSGLLFLLFTMIGLGAACCLVKPHWFGFAPMQKPGEHHGPSFVARYPWWGLFGMALNLGAWIGAWAPLSLPQWISGHTFVPLWLGYVLTIDALVFARRGTSLLSSRPGTFLLLFPASAITWWYFEYLNRFVQNWWYLSVNFDPLHYIVYSSLCFSTVLPAVFETAALLHTFRWFREAYQHGPALPRARPGIMLTAGAATLALLAYAPQPLFFLTWLAPLAVLLGGLWLAGGAHPLGPLDRGEYGLIARLAVAALICGFFWELWNFWSEPKWVYSVPYVNACRVFEMPLPGYTGYLPFGPICWAFWLVWRGLSTGSMKPVPEESYSPS
jgi:hypothetical protein